MNIVAGPSRRNNGFVADPKGILATGIVWRRRRASTTALSHTLSSDGELFTPMEKELTSDIEITQYARGDNALAALEQDARDGKRGLSSDRQALPPWAWRKTTTPIRLTAVRRSERRSERRGQR